MLKKPLSTEDKCDLIAQLNVPKKIPEHIWEKLILLFDKKLPPLTTEEKFEIINSVPNAKNNAYNQLLKFLELNEHDIDELIKTKKIKRVRNSVYFGDHRLIKSQFAQLVHLANSSKSMAKIASVTFPGLMKNTDIPLANECTNIVYEEDKNEVVKFVNAVYDENIVWCLTKDDIDQEHPDYNPFTGMNFDHSFPSDIKTGTDDKCIIPSQASIDFLDYWIRDIYTYGKCFVMIPYKIRKELASAIPQEKVLRVYRGMGWNTKGEYESFLDRLTKNETTVSFSTFSSWTTSKKTAFSFTDERRFRVVLECDVENTNIIVDVELFCNKNQWQGFKETEILLIPNRYKVRLVPIEERYIF